MNKQEIFNKVWNGFKNQNWERSIDEENGCAYRGRCGTKCAVGHLIPDEEYRSLMEGNTFWGLIEAGIFSENLEKEFKDEMNFISNLQTIHDFEAKRHSLKYLLEELAKNHNLEIPKD